MTTNINERIEEFQNEQAGVSEYAISVLKSEPHLFSGTEPEVMNEVGTIVIHDAGSVNQPAINSKGMDALREAGLRIRSLRSMPDHLRVQFERTE